MSKLQLPVTVSDYISPNLPRAIDSISDLANYAWDVYNARAEACPTHDMDGSYFHYDPDADDTANSQITALAAMFGFEFKAIKREMDRMEHAAMEQDYERYAMGGN